MIKITLQRNVVPAHLQVAAQLRKSIQIGKLPPGSQLPPQMELAATLDMSCSTIQLAFQELVRDGLVVSHRRRGTFVVESLPGLRSVGLYYQSGALMYPEHHYLRAVHSAVLGYCHDRGLETAIFHDSRPMSTDVTPPPELVEAVEQRRVEALILPSTDKTILKRLGKLDVPIAYHGTPAIGNAVTYDGRQFVDLALAELHAADCRTVGLVSSFSTRVKPNLPGRIHEHVEFTRHFIERIGELGMGIRDGWICEPREENEIHDRHMSFEQYGYEMALALLNEPELPDGLVVYPDSVARGVILALMTQSERTANLQLVLHKNAEVPFPCPLPARFIVSSAAEVARELLAMAERMFAGRPHGGPRYVPFSVESSVNHAPAGGAGADGIRQPASTRQEKRL